VVGAVTDHVDVVYSYSPELLSYDFGPGHPFRPERALYTYQALEAAGFFTQEGVRLLEPTPAPAETIQLFHARDYVEALLAEDEEKLLYYGIGFGDNPFFEGIGRASSLVVGATPGADGALMGADGARLAFSFSGGLHHAHPRYASGFCILNDAAIAIRLWLNDAATHGRERSGVVAYVDIDAHHGDGVLYGFQDDPRVLCISIHESGRYLFPGTGFANERGRGDALSYTMNLPLPPGSGDTEFVQLLDRYVFPALDFVEPELLVVQAGTDGYKDDPLAHLHYTQFAYLAFLEHLLSFIGAHPETRVLILGGGGYVPWFASLMWASIALSLRNGIVLDPASLPPAALAQIPDAPTRFLPPPPGAAGTSRPAPLPPEYARVLEETHSHASITLSLIRGPGTGSDPGSDPVPDPRDW
jgi:acetoin utilization protein AcuC